MFYFMQQKKLGVKIKYEDLIKFCSAKFSGNTP